MAYFLLMLKTSPNEVTKSGEIFSSGKLPKLPDFVKRVNTFIAVDEKILSFSIYEVPNDKMWEGYLSIATRYAGYRIVEGFTYKIEALATVQEALPMIGLGKK